MRSISQTIVPGKVVMVQLVILVLGLEFCSFIATKLELFPINATPGIYSKNSGMPDILLGRTEKDPWGAWHAPNGSFRHATTCFDVVMTFNEVGARDSSFAETAGDSILLLGDSFAEGFGVPHDNTSAFMLERFLDRNLLNFGASGDFGPLQELLLYRHFHEIEHSGLVVYILPANDFTDNDRNFWTESRGRYRPYFGSQEDPLSPYYFPEATPRSSSQKMTFSLSVKNFIKQYLWLGNAIRTIRVLLNHQVSEDNNTSFYYDSTDTQQKNLLLAYEGILQLAEGKDVLFVLIPWQQDITRYRSSSGGDSYRRQKWYQGFQRFTESNEQNVHILDLMEHLPAESNHLFLPCDPHWGIAGNLWASEVIHQYIVENDLFN